MPRKVNPVPKGYRTATPYLTVRGVEVAIDFYHRAFGAEQLSCVYGTDGLTIVHAEMKIGNSIVLLGEEMPDFGIWSPASLQGSASAIHLYLPKVADIWEQALEAGAIVAVPLSEVYWGELFGKIVDPFGHLWSLSKRVEMLSPQEIATRASAGLAVIEAEVTETDLVHASDELEGATA